MLRALVTWSQRFDLVVKLSRASNGAEINLIHKPHLVENTGADPRDTIHLCLALEHLCLALENQSNFTNSTPPFQNPGSYPGDILTSY